MTQAHILTTADSFPAIEKATSDWFKRPLRLIFKDDHNWRVCLPDMTPFGTVNSYYVVRQGTKYRLESRQSSQQPIVQRGAAR